VAEGEAIKRLIGIEAHANLKSQGEPPDAAEDRVTAK